MKKIYLSICALAVSLSSIAQEANVFVTPSLANEKMQINDLSKEETSINNSSSSMLAPAPFWTNNFDTPTDWVLDNNGQTSPNGWTIDAVADGWWSSNGITSTSGGNFAELTNGDPTASTQMLNVVYTMTLANSIDVLSLAGTDNVTLEFEEFGARFNDLQEVQVSTDGINFVTVGNNLGYSVLSQSGGSPYSNPETRSINIKPYIAGNASSVWIRFSWTTNYPNSATNPNVWIAYGWYIDDVQLITTPNYVMEAVDANHGGWNIGYQNTDGFGMDYTMKPLNQSAANPYLFELIAANHGAQTLEGAKLNVEVKNSSNQVVFTDESDTVHLNPLDTVVFLANNSFDPAAVGGYTINIWGSADSLPTTSVQSFEVAITDDVYARDAGSPSGSNRVARTCDGFESGNIFDMYAADDLTAVSAYIADYSVAGSSVYATVYEVDTTSSPWSYIMLDNTSDYTLQTQDIDNWVTINFDQPVSLVPGHYMVTVGGYMHPTDTFGISTSGPAEVGMSRIMSPNGGCPNYTAGTWYWMSTTPMVRMNFDPALISNINESNAEQSLFNVFPNPSNGEFVIELNKADNYTLTVNNILGQVVYTSLINEVSTNINLSNLEKGIYTIELKNNNKSFVEKVIIE